MSYGARQEAINALEVQYGLTTPTPDESSYLDPLNKLQTECVTFRFRAIE